jgi:hypothetical protein
MTATLLEHSTPKARKQHQCSCCLAHIDPGTEYVRQTIVDNGEMSVLKMHPACYSTLMDYSQYHALDADDQMPNWGEVQLWLHQNGENQ